MKDDDDGLPGVTLRLREHLTGFATRLGLSSTPPPPPSEVDALKQKVMVVLDLWERKLEEDRALSSGTRVELRGLIQEISNVIGRK